ncbi:MAG TPA: hypothetical protein VM118_05380 [Acidobacteriota bacterium]|nr:hypothetical protein [Acidobacteriota bacterium]
MSDARARLTARRAWYVPSVSIWGDLTADTVDTIATEIDDNATRVVFYRFGLGGEVQEINFASLTDHRGNALPGTISRPVVMAVPKNTVGVAVVGQPTDVSFRAGKTAITPEDGIVDLWIVEAGA